MKKIKKSHTEPTDLAKPFKLQMSNCGGEHVFADERTHFRRFRRTSALMIFEELVVEER